MSYADNHSIKVVEISDIVHGQFQDALVGVDAVIHVASPLPGRANPQEMLNVRSETNFETGELIILFVGCYRGLFECFTTSRESRCQEVHRYKLNDYCGRRSHSERDDLYS